MEDTTIEDVLKTVQELHNQKDYEGALRILEGNQNKISPGLWHYNMGTVHGKLENLPLSRYHFLMADQEGFSTRELFQNKELVETKLDISRLEKSLSASDYFVKAAIVGTEGIFTLVSLLFIIFAVVSVLKKMGAKVFVSLIAVAVVFLGLNFWVKSWNKFIVVETQPVHEGPSVIFQATGDLPAGVLLITTTEGDWLKIHYPSRFTGWIKAKGLKELK